MIILDAVTKIVGSGRNKRPVLDTVHASIPSNSRIAVLGPRAAHKRIFMNLIAGIALPDTGRIIRDARVSFPAGHAGGFTSDLPVRANVAHVARLYGADVESIVNFVSKISKLGKAYDKPFGDLSKTERRNLSEVLAFSLPFDVYLLSDDVVTPLRRSNTDIRALFEARAKTSGMIIMSEDQAFAREFCEMGFVLSDGEARLFDDLNEAIAVAEEAAHAVKEKAGNRRARKKSKAMASPSEEKKEKRVAKRKRRKEKKGEDQ